jgi:hypothetical protein
MGKRQGTRRWFWALCALLGLLGIASTSGAAGPTGIGKMTVSPNRVSAGSVNDLTLTYLSDSAPLNGQMRLDVPVAWSPPQRANRTGPGYVELDSAGCPGTRITGIVARRITIAARCPRRHLFRLVYHAATAPQFSADGYIFLTQTRPASKSKKVVFKPLGPRKQPVVRVRGAAATGLFMTVTSVATVGVPFGVTVRAIDQWGNNAADYPGTVTLASTDPAATLPGPYVYGPRDTAQHTFTGVTLRTPGVHRITAIDSNGFTVQSGPITVSQF